MRIAPPAKPSPELSVVWQKIFNNEFFFCNGLVNDLLKFG